MESYDPLDDLQKQYTTAIISLPMFTASVRTWALGCFELHDWDALYPVLSKSMIMQKSLNLTQLVRNLVLHLSSIRCNDCLDFLL